MSLGWRVCVLGAALVFGVPGTVVAQAASATDSRWVFAGFKGNSEDGVYYALSTDGYHWTLANGGKPVVKQTEAGS